MSAPADHASGRTSESTPRAQPLSGGGGLPSISARWASQQRVLNVLRDRLLEERDSDRAAAAQPLESHSMSLADSATDESDHELAWSQLAREEHALREVEDAIRRLAAGTYGVCEESGRPIPEERLRAVPWARFTKDVQERREREGLDRREVIPPLASIQEPGVAVMEGAEDPETDELIAREVERRQREEDVAALGRGADAAADGERTRKEPI